MLKKFFATKYGIPVTIILVTGTIVYFTTWGNKKWLIDKISDKGGAAPTAPGAAAPNLQSMGVSDLRKLLVKLS